MRKTLLAAAAGLVAAALAGCLETRQAFTVNPDGAGKVLVELTMPMGPQHLMMLGGAGAAAAPSSEADTDLAAKHFVKSMLDGSKGVETWSDVRYEKTDDGRVRFVGTAYFKDFAKLGLQSGGMEGIRLVKDDSGGMLLVVEPKQPEEPAAPDAAPPQVPEDQMAQRIAAQRQQYQMMRPMLEATLGAMKSDLEFRLPGTLAEVSGFTRQPSGAVRLAFEGTRLLAVMDELMTDDAYVRATVQGRKPAGMSGPPMDEAVFEKLFGTKPPLRARTTPPLAPLFSYEAEAKAAKDAYPAMIERLGLDKLPPPPPPSPMPPGFGLPEGRKGGVGTGVQPPPGPGAGG